MPTIVVIGASSKRNKFANICVRAYLSKGYTVIPVHPLETVVEGQTVYKSIADVPPGRIDRVSLYLPAEAGVKALDAIADRRPGELWLNPGADAPEVVAKAQALGINIVQGCSIVDIGVSPSQFMEG